MKTLFKVLLIAFVAFVAMLVIIVAIMPKEEFERVRVEKIKEDSLKIAKELKILDLRKEWADSVIKAAKGLVYESYESDFKDSLFISLTIRPSKDIDIYIEHELPFLQVSYSNYMKAALGEEYKDVFVVWPVVGKEYIALEKKYEKINTLITNGRFLDLEMVIREGLNDTDSFEHVLTEMEDKGKYVLVRITARAKNGFGAKILTQFDAKLGFDGSIISIKENN